MTNLLFETYVKEVLETVDKCRLPKVRVSADPPWRLA